MSGSRHARAYWDDRGLAALIGGVLLPPLAWLIDLETSYALVKWACLNDRREVILLPGAASLLVVAAAGWMSWSCWTKLKDRADSYGERVEDRSYFLAVVGLAISGTFALLILTSFVHRWSSPCG